MGKKFIPLFLKIVIVVIITGLLAIIIGQNIIERTNRAKVAACKQDLVDIANALDAYEADNGGYPTTNEGLRVLVENPYNKEVVQGEFIETPLWFPYLKKKDISNIRPMETSISI